MDLIHRIHKVQHRIGLNHLQLYDNGAHEHSNTLDNCFKKLSDNFHEHKISKFNKIFKFISKLNHEKKTRSFLLTLDFT